MDDAVIFRELNNLAPGRVRADESMRKHTSWRIGGPADLFVEPENSEELGQVIAYANNRGIMVMVIGAGSNLLVSDAGIKGIVIKLGTGMSKVTCSGNEITAEAGARLADVGTAAKKAGLGGFEFSVGIPGTVGGAIVMNAGVNGADIGNLVKQVVLVSPAGETLTRGKDSLAFGYRESILQREPAILTEATFSCYPKEKTIIQAETDAFLSRRKTSQPLRCPNAGSVFKNPPVEAAGRLIDAAGLKGIRIGGAQVSALHANFIVNLGNASAGDVAALIDRIQSEVRSRFGVDLQPEIRFAGFDPKF